MGASETSLALARRATVLVVGLLAGPCACAGAGAGVPRPTSPDALRDAYVQALRDDDPAAAYALLSDELKAETAPEQFEARWQSHANERAAALTALEASDAADATTLATGTTAHAEGRLVRWVEVDGHFVVVSGLPGLPDRATPSATVRAFIAATRAMDRTAVSALLGDDLREQTLEALGARADALERALDQPGPFDFEQGRTRAILRYGDPALAPGDAADRKLVLERDERGWRIIAFQ